MDLEGITENRYALYRKSDGSYVVEPEEWPGSRRKAALNAKARGLIRIGGSQDKATLDAWAAKLEAAKR